MRGALTLCVFRETASGPKTDWRAPSNPLAKATRLDRLARSMRDLLNTLDAIAKAGAGFHSLHDAWPDPTTPHGRLNSSLILSAPASAKGASAPRRAAFAWGGASM